MSQDICNMWLPLLLVLLPLGLVPISTMPQEESEDPTLKPLSQDTGQEDPRMALRVGGGQPTATPAALHRHVGLELQSQDDPQKGGGSLPSGETPCFATAGPEGDRLGQVLSALQDGWGKESELRRETLDQFGICTGSDGSDDAELSALTTLAADRGGDLSPWALHLDKGTVHLLSLYSEKKNLSFCLSFSMF